MKQSKGEVAGKAKRGVAEIVGEKKPQPEAKEQEDKAKREPGDASPFGNLNRLT
jgi:hypothetical protein